MPPARWLLPASASRAGAPGCLAGGVRVRQLLLGPRGALPTAKDRPRRRLPVPARSVASEAATPGVRPSSAAELGPSLENPVVVLEVANPQAPDGTTRVYLLGVSHVSKADCQKVEELIRVVRPEVVMVELCQERTGLLVDGRFGDAGLWHTRAVALAGLPAGEGWPAADALLAPLSTRPGAAVTLAQIEDDCEALLATGLFRTVRPVISPPGPQDAPHFAVEPLPSGRERVAAVQPMGGLTFEVSPRLLPPVKHCDVELCGAAAAVGQEAATAAAEALVAASAAGRPTLDAILEAQAALRAAARRAGVATAAVAVEGVDTGRLVLRVTAASEAAGVARTGLEGTAVGGKGWGIEPAPRRHPASDEVPAAAEPAVAPATQWRPWEAAKVDAASVQLPKDGLAEAFGTAVARVYAGFQADAGRAVGISPGAAWRAALTASAEHGVQQVILGDRPAEVTRRRLAAGIFGAIGVQVLGGAGLLGAAVAAQAAGALPEGAEAPLLAAAVLATGASAWPLLGPLAEVARFSRQSAQEIEETVRVKAPLQGSTAMLKLWGEDAITDFPGAAQSIIGERDVYMAEVLHATATGDGALAPAYVLAGHRRGNKPVFSYMMPEGGPAGGCPRGAGDGAYLPLPGVSAVVGVVGTAHVHGIKEHWRAAGASPVELLEGLARVEQ